MVVASASPAALIAAGFGHIESCWRRLNMTITPSSPSLTQMNACLEIINYLLEHSPFSLSDYEKIALCKLGISLAENMEKRPDGPIIIWLSSAIPPADTEPPEFENSEKVKLSHAVPNVTHFIVSGAKDRYYSVHSNPNPPRISRGILRRNSHLILVSNQIDSRNSHECLYGLGSDLE